MSMWAQIQDDRATQIPPDGDTVVDVYVDFSFSGESVPEGVVVKFIAGKGNLEFGAGGEQAVKKWTESEVLSSISAMDGVELLVLESKTERTLIRNGSGKLESRIVAKTSLKPIAEVLKDEISVVAYTSYDRLGIIPDRLQPDIVKLPVASGGGVFLSVAERYDPSSNSWETITPMNVGRSGLVAESVGGKVYAMGGFAGVFLNANEEYDPSSDLWVAKEPIPTAKAFAMSAEHGGEIFVMGGMDFSPGACLKSVHKYNPSSDSWTQLADMPLPVAFGTARKVGGDIYVMFGASSIGGTGKGETERIERFNLAVLKYNILADEWTLDDVQLSSPTTTTLSSGVAAGGTAIQIPTATSLPPYGVLIINDGGGNEEVVSYASYDSKAGIARLDTGLSLAHSAGESVKLASIPEIRMAPNSAVSGSSVEVFNGQQFLAYSGSTGGLIRGTLCSYDTVTKTFSCGTSSPSLPRSKASTALVGSKTYIVGGSSRKSQWANETESLESGTFSGPAGLDEMLFPRHSMGATATGGLVYALGGAGDGHAPGWLRITVETTPEDVRADGRETSSIRIEAVDASGDPPPDGTKFIVRGLIYVTATKEQQDAFKAQLEETSTSAVQTSTGESAVAPTPQRISILPVLFSANEITNSNGIASTIALPRSEDPIREVSNLAAFVKSGEAVVDETKLKEQLGFPESEEDKIQVAGQRRDLYNAAIEISVDDPFFFGTTNTDSLIASKTQENAQEAGEETASTDFEPADLSSDDSFSFNPPPAEQGLSASITFYSDIVSIPDVQLVTEEPVSGDEAKDVLEEISQEVPFGASPLFDAMIESAAPRTDDVPSPPLEPPTSIFLAASDNDESYSSRSAQDVVDDVNGINGANQSPVFVTSFVVTDPVSLSARRARTDIADLEKISSETGGNSFSVVSPSYIDFVIERIKTSAPSSIGSGTAAATHEIEGYLSSVSMVVSNLVQGNSASMSVSHSDDGYNFTPIDEEIQPNVTHTFGTPINARFVKYVVTLRSKTFDSPRLESVSLNFTRPNEQYLFTFPQTISGEVSELAAVNNHRLPDGSFVEMGFAHGESFMFDRDYKSITQPPITERGSILAVTRAFDTTIGEASTKDVLRTDNLLLYESISGPWSQEAETRVFVNDVLAGQESYILVPENGLVAFRKKLNPSDEVFVEVDQPSTFRFGMKLVNPSSSATGFLDSFAYMWGTTQDEQGYRLNRAPRAVNLFMSPSPILPGGPIEAHYTFVDPDGDEEDTSQSVITWFRNGVPMPELSGKRTVRNIDLVARRADGPSALGIAKGQEWFFTVRPSDGKAFGPTASSAKAIVANVPPSTLEVQLQSSNNDPAEFTSQDSIKAVFEFKDADGDALSGSIFTWFVNDVEVQSGVSDSLEPISAETETRLFRAGDSVRCEVIPSDGTDFGTSVSSDSITVEGSPPSVEEVAILPKSPSSLSNLRLTYKFIDADERTDSSTIQWFRNDQRVSELDGTRQVASSFLTPGQEWYAEVTPDNGLATGEPSKSNVVVIEF